MIGFITILVIIIGFVHASTVVWSTRQYRKPDSYYYDRGFFDLIFGKRD